MTASSTPLRDIIAIDESLCNGCGSCLPDLVRKAQEKAGTSLPRRTSALTRFGQEEPSGFEKKRTDHA